MSNFKRILLMVLTLTVSFLLPAPTRADGVEGPIYIYASQPGSPTLDQGEGGGNPFASALVELLGQDKLTFETFQTELVTLTMIRSRRFQVPQVVTSHNNNTWQVAPMPADEKRIALVLVYSDYSASAASSLPGAKHDMNRVATALKRAGFLVQTLLDPSREDLGITLVKFATRSAESDVAVLYTTGHGIEVDGVTYLLRGDYPVELGKSALSDHAVELTSLSSALQASDTNLIFYAGCRDNPLRTQ